MDAQPIANLTPHYTDDHFRDAQTVWIEKGYSVNRSQTVKGASYNYSDRIWEWNWNKADTVRKSIEHLDRRSPAYIQEFLRRYFDNPAIRLVHVMAGFNVSNGSSYNVYGYFEE